MRRDRQVRGIPLRALVPNAITAAAMCFGLTAIQTAVRAGNGDIGPSGWSMAIVLILIAGLLDGIDGRVARALRGESKFGAELDSLSDSLAFGVAPALTLYFWSLNAEPRWGWAIALVYAVFAALRLARFNARIDLVEQPHKSAGFLTGVPAPAGAIIAFLPMYLWIWTDEPVFRSPYLVGPWLLVCAVLLVSSIATFSPSSLKLRQNIRFEAIVVVAAIAAAVISAPWPALTIIAIAYLATIPFSIRSYQRVRRLRASGSGQRPPAGDAPPAA